MSHSHLFLLELKIGSGTGRSGGAGIGPLEVVMVVDPKFAKLFIADTSGDEAHKFAFFTIRKF